MVAPYVAFFNAKNPNILALWKLGYSIVPVRPNKRPLIYTWQQYQRDKPPEFEIRSWAGRFGGQPHNYALVSGNTSGCRHQLVVVDADDLEAVEFCDSKLPPTLTVSRCPGKKHYYFRRPNVPSICNRSKLTVDGTVYNIDLRADGGLVIIPGSVHESGDVYQASQSIDRETLANLPVYDPSWMGWSLVDEPHTKVVRSVEIGDVVEIKASSGSWQAEQAAEYLTHCPGATAGQGAGGYALKLAQTLVHRYSLDEETAKELLLQWGQRSDNQYEDGSYYPWSAREIAHKIDETIKLGYEGVPGDKLDEAAWQSGQIFHGWDGACLIAPEAPEPPKDSKDVFPIWKPGTAKRTLPPWLIQGWFKKGHAVLLYGPTRSFKSFISLDWALCLAMGIEWNGKKVRQSRVLYVCAEGEGGLEKRVEAWCIKNLVDPKELQANFSAITTGVPIDNEDQFDKLIDTAKHYGEAWEVIILDTVDRNMEGVESDTKDMKKFVDAAIELRTLFKNTIVMVHHTGKDTSKGSKGDNRLPNAADDIFEVTRPIDSNRIMIGCRKMKDTADDWATYFRSEIVPTGIYDEHGIEETSLVLHPITEAEYATKPIRELSDEEKLILNLLPNLSGGLTDEEVETSAMAISELAKSIKVDRRKTSELCSGLVSKGLVAKRRIGNPAYVWIPS